MSTDIRNGGDQSLFDCANQEHEQKETGPGKTYKNGKLPDRIPLTVDQLISELQNYGLKEKTFVVSHYESYVFLCKYCNYEFQHLNDNYCPDCGSPLTIDDKVLSKVRRIILHQI